MLILSRKKNESIMIGDVKVVVVRFQGSHRVQIGVDAPKDVTVHRQEVHDAIRDAANEVPHLKTSCAKT